MKSFFEGLEIYQVAEQIADSIWDMVLKWPIFARDTIGKQLVRCADSIAANISEGSGRGTKPEFIRFLRIARGSFNETKNFLRRAYKRNLMSKTEIDHIKPLMDSLIPKLNAYISSLKK